MENENNTPAPTLLNHVIRWGIIMAAASILITVAMYVINEALMVQLKVLFISLLIYLGLTIYAGIDYRKQVGGYLSFGNAFVHGFLIMALSGLIGTAFNVVLYQVIDTELAQRLTDVAIENQREMMIGFGAPEDQIDEALEKAREQTADRFTVSGMAMGYIFALIFSAIMALISALFVRKNQPLEM